MKSFSKKTYDMPKGLRSQVMLVPKPSNRSYNGGEASPRDDKQEKNGLKIHGHHKQFRLQRDGNDFHINNVNREDEVDPFEADGGGCSELVCLKLPTLQDLIEIHYVQKRERNIECINEIQKVHVLKEFQNGDEDDGWTLL